MPQKKVLGELATRMPLFKMAHGSTRSRKWRLGSWALEEKARKQIARCFSSRHFLFCFHPVQKLSSERAALEKGSMAISQQSRKNYFRVSEKIFGTNRKTSEYQDLWKSSTPGLLPPAEKNLMGTFAVWPNGLFLPKCRFAIRSSFLHLFVVRTVWKEYTCSRFHQKLAGLTCDLARSSS